MRPHFGFVAVVFLLSATAFGHDADWWYTKYQKLGDTNPKWDALVREGIDLWQKAPEPETDLWHPQDMNGELALSAKALEKAYAAGCRCPIVLFIDARNLSLTGKGYESLARFRESLKRTEKRPDLAFVRIHCSNTYAWSCLSSSSQFEEAVRYFEMALSLSSPDVEEATFKEARIGLQQAREKLVSDQEQRDQLAALTLPASPTKEQAREYVRKIIDLIDKKEVGNSERDIPMLEKVGPENLDVLLEMWPTSGVKHGTRIGGYLKLAVDALARPEHKALLLKWLPLHEDLVEVMLGRGWREDMRPFLLARIAERKEDTAMEIVNAAIKLRDPASYNDLIWHLEHNMNGPNFYDDVKKLPGIQLKYAALRSWETSKSPMAWSREGQRLLIALAAMDYGATDALGLIVEDLNSPEVKQRYGMPERLREAIRQRTGQRGSNDEIRAWFRANEEKLVFDEKTRMYVPTP
jgi:tetratricopeptide (TPR) repeat protein